MSETTKSTEKPSKAEDNAKDLVLDQNLKNKDTVPKDNAQLEETSSAEQPKSNETTKESQGETTLQPDSKYEQDVKDNQSVDSKGDKTETAGKNTTTSASIPAKDDVVQDGGKAETSNNAATTQANNDEETDEDDEGICLGDRPDLDKDGRNKMFERGLSFERNGKKNKALKCYLACLNGLKHDTRFPLLPQCLRNIADIFYQKEEYEKAVHFIQAEKVFYESALIDTTDIQHKLEDAQMKEGGLKHSTSTDTVRASEYEHLAKLCLDKGQPQLALEYAGKATKLRQQVLGDTDPVTVESLDFFASVYAKVGAEQYEESLKKFTDKPADNEAVGESSNDQKEPVSILRKRKNSEKEKKVHFDESQLQSHEQIENASTQDMLVNSSEERCAKSVLWALLVICCMLLIILGIYLYCSLVGSNTCISFKSDLHYGYMRVKYWYYHYQSGPNAKFM